MVQYLCARGITVAAPNVRGSTGYGRSFHQLDDVEKRLDSVADLTALARALGAGGGTPVAVMGGSYGGYMTMAAITEEPDIWAAAVNTVGIVNFVTFLERTGAVPPRAARGRVRLAGARPRVPRVDLADPQGRPHPRAAAWSSTAPTTRACPWARRSRSSTALRARDHPVEYLRYEDEGHGIVRLPNRLDCYPRVAAFLERHLGLA